MTNIVEDIAKRFGWRPGESANLDDWLRAELQLAQAYRNVIRPLLDEARAKEVEADVAGRSAKADAEQV
jgi:hypothetical protein